MRNMTEQRIKEMQEAIEYFQRDRSNTYLRICEIQKGFLNKLYRENKDNNGRKIV